MVQKICVPLWQTNYTLMTYGYIRVSTDRQTVENQRFEISQFCAREGVELGGWIEETVSGTRHYSKRRLGTLLKHLRKGDIIVCSELSRLGRNLYMIMEILSYCMHKGCLVWTVKDGYRLGDDIQSKVLAFAFGLSAEIERNLISQRTKEALLRIKAEGKHVGRPKGRKNRPESHPLHGKEAFIRQAMRAGISQRQLAKRLKCNHTTLRRFMQTMEVR